MSDEKPQLRSFLDKCRVAKGAQSKEIRLTIHEAEQLGAAIGFGRLEEELDVFISGKAMR